MRNLVLKASLFVLAISATAVSFADTSSFQEMKDFVSAADKDTKIYTAREIITMAPGGKAEAVAVRDGRFVAVGTRAEVEKAAGKDAQWDDTFKDKVLMAGFVEQHVHPVLAALTMTTKVISIEDWDTADGFSPAVRDQETYRKRLLAALEEHRSGADKNRIFITWGYHHYLHGDKMSRALLNTLAPDFPVVVWHRSCHEFYLNDRALKLAGIDSAFFASLPKSAREQADLEKGHFYEQGALAILSKLAPIIATKEQFVKGLNYTKTYYHRNGITTACEPGGFPSKAIQNLINSVYSDDLTPFNHYFMADGKSLAVDNRTSATKMLSETEKILDWGRGRTHYLPKQVKLLTDGAIYSQLMMMKDGYPDGHKGAWIMDPAVFSYAFQSYWDAGYQIHVHNNGDAGLDVLLGELEKAIARKPRTDHRTVLVHFGFARPEQTEKWVKLGGIISGNPYYVTALAGPYEKINMGARWAANIVPFGDALKHGGSISFHSDMPMAPAKPLELIWAAMNRITYEGNVAGPQHIVPLEVALRAMTIDAAYSIQLEKQIGSIEVGKLANITVLEKSPYAVAADKIKEIPVWGTMLEGRIQQAVQQKTSSMKATAMAAGSQNRSKAVSVDNSESDDHTHSHTHGDCCSCTMNRAFAMAMAPGVTR